MFLSVQLNFVILSDCLERSSEINRQLLLQPDIWDFENNKSDCTEQEDLLQDIEEKIHDE